MRAGEQYDGPRPITAIVTAAPRVNCRLRTLARIVAALLVTAPVRSAVAQQCPHGVLPAYSHNDYENARPLADALALGYRGVETDVFLVDGVLRVGHDRRRARGSGSLEDLYLAPLQALLSRCGRVTPDSIPFLLAVEVKESSAATHDSLVALIRRYPALRERLGATRTPPIQLILVGWRPPLHGSRRAGGMPDGGDVAWQHRLTRRDTSGFGGLEPNVRLLSVDYGKTFGRWWTNARQRRQWIATLEHVRSVAPGRLLRVHNVPPNRYVYADLLNAGVDLIGTKDLAKTARMLRESR